MSVCGDCANYDVANEHMGQADCLLHKLKVSWQGQLCKDGFKPIAKTIQEPQPILPVALRPDGFPWNVRMHIEDRSFTFEDIVHAAQAYHEKRIAWEDYKTVIVNSAPSAYIKYITGVEDQRMDYAYCSRRGDRIFYELLGEVGKKPVAQPFLVTRLLVTRYDEHEVTNDKS